MKEERLQLIPLKYKGTLRNCYKELYAKKCENLDEMDKFLENIIFQNSMKKKQKA